MTDIMTRASPPDWQLYRLGQLFRERKEKGSDKDFPPLSVTMGGIVPQLETAAKTDDGDNRKVVRVGDYVINSRSDRKGAGGISVHEGSVSLISIVLEPRTIDPRFAHHLLRSPAFQEEFYRWGHGIVADLWTTRYADMKNIRLRVPDLATQSRIADFLDRETERIDLLIEKRQRLVALLREREEVLIEDQLNALDAALIHRLKFAIRRIEQGWSPQCEDTPVEGEKWGVLKLGAITTGAYLEDQHKALPETIDPIPSLRVNVNDVLVARASGSPTLVGKAAFVETATLNLMLSDKHFRLVPNPKKVLPEYLSTIVNSGKSRSQIEERLSSAEGMAWNISQSVIYGLRCPFPPLETQKKILGILRSSRRNTNAIVSRTNTSIDRLKEYRSSLITAAVTGQIDVETYANSGTTDRHLDAIQEEVPV